MLHLRPIFNAKLLTPEITEELRSGMDLQKAMAALVKSYNEFGGDAPLYVATDSAMDEEGVLYEDVKLRVTGRMNVKGERWFVSGAVAVSLDALLDTFEELYAALYE